MKLDREYQIAALMALSAFFTLAGYEAIRSPATVLFKTTYGANNLPVVMAIMPVVVFLGVAIYGRILSAVGPRRTLLVTTLGSGLMIFCCYLAILAGSEITTAILYIVKELYIVLLIEQYWSYINSSLAADTAKKVNGAITGIAGLGGVAGAFVVSYLAEPLGTEALLLFAALSVIPAALVSQYAYRRHGEPEVPEMLQISKGTGHMGLALFRESRTLRYLLAVVLATQVLSAVLDLKFQGLLSIQFAGQPDSETAFQAWFYTRINAAAMMMQFIVIPVILSLVPLRWVHILMPTIHLTAITVAIIEPTVFTVGLAFFLFKAFDYSLFRAAKEILYIPLSYDMRYRAKEVIDVFAYRTGKGASSVVIVGLQRLGVTMTNYYTMVAFLAAGLWLTLIFPLTKDVDKASQRLERTRF